MKNQRLLLATFVGALLALAVASPIYFLALRGSFVGTWLDHLAD